METRCSASCYIYFHTSFTSLALWWCAFDHPLFYIKLGRIPGHSTFLEPTCSEATSLTVHLVFRDEPHDTSHTIPNKCSRCCVIRLDLKVNPHEAQYQEHHCKPRASLAGDEISGLQNVLLALPFCLFFVYVIVFFHVKNFRYCYYF
jgi:hypothetical protein